MSSRLLYVVGPSGSGKDSIIAHARHVLSGQALVQFAHRYITRPANSGGENHIALSEAEFNARAQAGLFAMHWQSHGNSYGIGIEINQWLSKGITVVVNGSREYLKQASQNYPELLPVQIEVDTMLLKKRLLDRGRESETAIDARLHRNLILRHSLPHLTTIHNNHSLQQAGEELVSLIERHMRVSLCE